MIEFKKELLTLKYLDIYKVSTHGIITYKENNEEKKLKCPRYIIQQFKKSTFRSKFKYGKRSCILFYDNNPVSIETPTAAISDIRERVNFNINWVSSFERGIKQINEFFEDKENEKFKAFIDGKFVFLLEKKEKLEKNEMPYENAELASDDGFYTANCKAFNLKTLGLRKDTETTINSRRTCILYHVLNESTGEYITAVSPTISGIKYKDKETKAINFDKMDTSFYVNLNFILNSTKTVGESYGFDSIAFLKLEEVLIQMNTVNLFSFPDYIRNITPIQQTFKECLAWIIGLSYRETDLKYLLEYRGILAGLLDSFLVKKDYIDNNFKDSIFNDDIKVFSKEELEEKYKYLGELEKSKITVNESQYNKFLI